MIEEEGMGGNVEQKDRLLWLKIQGVLVINMY